STTLSVTTNEAATCAWSNTAGSAFASMTPFTTTGGTSHSTTLTGLSNGSSYTTYVKCKDTAGNISTDSSTAYSVAASSGGGGSSSCSQATTFLSRVSVDAAHQTNYANLICGLVADGIWSKLDVLYIFATQNSSAALDNLISSSFTATPSGSPTFTVDRGYIMSGSNLINTNYNFATNGTNYTQNAASIGGWTGTTASNYNSSWFTSTAYGGDTFIETYDPGSSVAAFSINGTAKMTIANTVASGMFAVVRSDANTESLYHNGSLLSSQARGTVALENGTFEAGYGTIRAAFAGGGLSASDVSNLYTLLSAYMQAVGATP
ncbi:MAG TPA: hypothetical protein VMU25_04170, partial [Candidatus Paceibacterota bacterium]|nr:hypothetical protein [Candidatus Paceibacterota bacterium]